MTKVVYNSCSGGFGISREAVLLGRKISGDPTWGGPCIIGDEIIRYGNNKTIIDKDYGSSTVKRTDPVLVQVVEMLGKKANGIFANLEIEDIPSGTQYRIEEHDGSEWIEYNTPDYWEIA